MSLYVNGVWVSNSPDLDIHLGANVTATGSHDIENDRCRVQLDGSTGGGQVVYGSTAGTACEGNDARLSDARAPLSHGHAQSDVTGLVSDLSGKAAASHTHSQSEVTSLVADLAAKAAAIHSHTGADIDESTLDVGLMSGTLSTGRGGTSATTPSAALNNLSPATTTGDLIVKANTGSHARLPVGSNNQVLTADSAQPAGMRWASPASGSDPWNYVKVTGSNFSATSASAVDVTGLAFTPAANTSYEFEAFLMIRTATTTVNPRVGLAWPTGMTDGVAMIEESQAATTAPICANGNVNAALLIPVGGLPNNTQSWPVRIHGMVIAGTSPSGTVRVQLATETAGTSVSIVVGSFLSWRVI